MLLEVILCKFNRVFWMKVSFEIFPLGARVLLWKIEFHLLGVSSVVLPDWCGLNGGKNTRQ